jgi:hypothetical protein
MEEAILFSNVEKLKLNQLPHSDVCRDKLRNKKTDRIPVIFFCSVMKGTKLRYDISILLLPSLQL